MRKAQTLINTSSQAPILANQPTMLCPKVKEIPESIDQRIQGLLEELKRPQNRDDAAVPQASETSVLLTK